jgi:DNA-directed RNA polymerase specialized sigma24 family protein
MGSSADPGSITRWIDDLKAGDAAAAQPLWERYFDRLVRMARARFMASRRRGAEADEEDAALSAFDSFCAGAARGRFPQLTDRQDLWRLLVVITGRKARAILERHRCQKRGGDRITIGLGGPSSDYSEEGLRLEQIAGHEPTPEFAAMVAEEYERLLERLGDDDLRQVALWRMEGFTNDEIAEKLGCARRTVARRLDLIRKLWLAESS